MTLSALSALDRPLTPFLVMQLAQTWLAGADQHQLKKSHGVQHKHTCSMFKCVTDKLSDEVLARRGLGVADTPALDSWKLADRSTRHGLS